MTTPTIPASSRPRLAALPRVPLDRPVTIVALVVLQVVVAIASSYSVTLATAVAALSLLAALAVAGLGRRIDLAVGAAVYVGSSDVLWRMTQAKVPWEIGKYALMAILVLVLFRHCKRLTRAVAPLVYLAVIIPSAALTVSALSPSLARSEVSFALSGPVALGVCALAFRQMTATEGEIRHLLWLAVLPITGVAALATKGTIAAGRITFTGESNFVTSGGFGPNQVSTILGAGAVCCLLIMLSHTTRHTRFVALAVGLWCVGQALLTLSRGGVWGSVASASGIAIVGLVSAGWRSKVITYGVILAVVAVVIYSWLNFFTGGALGFRYAEAGSTNRSDIAQGDLGLFSSHPLLGVGPGMAKFQRGGVIDSDANTHTEYTRLLAEHGALGVIALAALAVMVVQSIAWSTTVWNRFLAAGGMAYALFTMSHSATRIAIVAVMFGLGCLRIDDRSSDDVPNDDVANDDVRPELVAAAVPIARQPLRIRARR